MKIQARFITILCIGLVSLCSAQKPAQNIPGRMVYMVIHIDAMPQYAKAAAGLLDTLKIDTRKQPGLKNLRVLQEAVRPNHFTVLEEWSDMSAYEAFVSTTLSRQFRDRIQPMLGSPFDERMHIELK